ncbi:15423_t:CDS:2 [Gigaspora rosea]|nr:15423_t:CDS:2 [Gigaspora rosea]
MTNLIVNLNAGQLAAILGIIGFFLPLIITGVGIMVTMNVNDRMTALEWTALSKLTERSLLSFYGAAGQSAITGIKFIIWVSAIAPLDLLTRAINNAFTPNQLSQVRICGASNDNITYPEYDFMMGEVASTQSGIVDTMIVDHDNCGFLASHTIQPKQKIVSIQQISSANILCVKFGGQDSVSDKAVGFKCWTVFGPPNITERGIEQTLNGCAATVKASVEVIIMQSNSTGDINVLGKQNVPMNWYIEN